MRDEGFSYGLQFSLNVNRYYDMSFVNTVPVPLLTINKSVHTFFRIWVPNENFDKSKTVSKDPAKSWISNAEQNHVIKFEV